MSKFTAVEDHVGWAIIGKNGRVADVYGDHAKEKATLFAAATDLLAAAKLAADQIAEIDAYNDDNPQADAYAALIGAIARAEGRTK